MEQNRTAFGRMPDGAQVDLLTLRDGALTCEIITYGGAVRSLSVPDRAGNPVDVVLGFDAWRATSPKTNISALLWGGTPTASAGQGSP